MNKKIGIGLSGGGFRATLYNLGALIRLNELGILHEVSRITSVSGGSITSAVLAKYWDNLQFTEATNVGYVATNFKEEITDRLWEFCSQNFDKNVILSGLFSFTDSVATKSAARYDRVLFDGTTLGDVTSVNKSQPQFLFYGTGLQTRSAVRMVDGILYDWRVGAVDISDWTLGRVVGISSAFPPLMAPVKIDMEGKDWLPSTYQKKFNDPSYKDKLILLDGGVYDNMGMEALWKKSKDKLKATDHTYNAILNDEIDICLISDAGGPTPAQPVPKSNWGSLLMRTLDQTIEQARSVRKRWFIDKLINQDVEGAYFGITTKINSYGIDALVKDSPVTNELKKVGTRLTSFDDDCKGQLINWGYALCDAAIERRVPSLFKDGAIRQLPFPQHPLN